MPALEATSDPMTSRCPTLPAMCAVLLVMACATSTPAVAVSVPDSVVDLPAVTGDLCLADSRGVSAERFAYGRMTVPARVVGVVPVSTAPAIAAADSISADSTTRGQVRDRDTLVTGSEARKRLIVFGAVIVAVYIVAVAYAASNPGVWF